MEKLVAMARTAAEKKAEKDRWTGTEVSDAPDYPYGLTITLNDAELKKLGIKELPEVGDEFHIYAVCEVTRVSAFAGKDQPDNRSIELQITDMGAMHEDEGSPASKLYPDEKE